MTSTSGKGVFFSKPCTLSQILERTKPAHIHQSGRLKDFVYFNTFIIQVSFSINKIISSSFLIMTLSPFSSLFKSPLILKSMFCSIQLLLLQTLYSYKTDALHLAHFYYHYLKLIDLRLGSLPILLLILLIFFRSLAFYIQGQLLALQFLHICHFSRNGILVSYQSIRQFFR